MKNEECKCQETVERFIGFTSFSLKIWHNNQLQWQTNKRSIIRLLDKAQPIYQIHVKVNPLMNKRIILIVVGLIILAFAIFSGSLFTKNGNKDTTINEVPPSERVVPVDIIEIENQEVQLQIELSGRLQPEEQIEIFAEVSGVLLRTNPPFREGNTFNKGQVLINIDSREHRQNLISMRSNFLSALTQLLPDIKLDFEESYDQWVHYVEAFDPEGWMPELPEPNSQQERYFLTGRNIYSQFHDIRQLEIRATKFQIRAPFTGSVTRSDINPGALVRSGQPLGEFAKLHSYELLATVRVDDLPFINVGNEVWLSTNAIPGKWRGTVSRISEKVDPATQMVNIYVRTTGEDLRQGIFLEGQINADRVKGAAVIPRQLLKEGKEVFIIQDGIAQLKQVEVVHTQEGSVVVRGLQDNELVINEQRGPEFQGTRVSQIGSQN